MKVGTKSVLFGAHCFFLHPFFVAAAWTKLYGFPLDPRLWVAFFVHDLGYWGKPNMDGVEGERHVEFGVVLMSLLFDRKDRGPEIIERTPDSAAQWLYGEIPQQCIGPWGEFALYHSRYYAKREGRAPSRLCFADKLAFALTPWWLYLPMVTATGEIREYLRNAQKDEGPYWRPPGYDKRRWHWQLSCYMRAWVDTHKAGAMDGWTDAERHARHDADVSGAF